MSKKNFIIIALTCAAILAILGIGAHVLVEKYTEYSVEKALIYQANAFIVSDDEFVKQYGAVASVTLIPDQHIQKIHNKECVIPCLVTVSSGMVYEVYLNK